MRIFAVGATGVLGGALVPELLGRGHRVTVMAPDRLDGVPDRAEAVAGDLLDAGTDLAPLVEGHDAVVNVATSMPRDPSRPGAWALAGRVRSEGTPRLVDAVRRASVGRMVQMSITMAYAPGGDRWLREDAPFDPDPARRALVGPVAEMEDAVTAVPPGELAWTVLRGARFVGPGTVQDAQRDLLSRGALSVPGEEGSYVSMVHVADFADAVVAAVERGLVGRVLNVADIPVRVGDYYRALAERTGTPAPPTDPGTAPDLPSHRVWSGAAGTELGWAPRRGVLPEPVPAHG
ncbi:NAD(P)-dependent oxidoreductase [Nocardiopsis sp. RSe5-2]|uniref:NAD(P)-dependent oxidoreductase n=1 Tax=Nocardiopsis endophytica TaxID=3018445 RepID=A0ABT4U380_9ACTN|nr:NAD(P)-dependent oxidoreductase [Nocardiopsis endophytica]MDA2811412.1 NAD(P)-dependent oxidoreductase [Nocardiopsis endophytica]